MQTLGKGVLKLEAQVSLLLWSPDYLETSVFSFLEKKKKKNRNASPKTPAHGLILKFGSKGTETVQSVS